MLWVSEHGLITRGNVNRCTGDGNLELCPLDFDACSSLLDSSGNEDADLEPVFTYARPYGREQLRVHNYVGVISTETGTQIEVLPKVSKRTDEWGARRLLVKMLMELGDSPFRIAPAADLDAHRMPLFEILMRQFLEHSLHIVRKGIARNYVGEQDNLVFLRGKLKIADHIRQNTVTQDRFWCEYDEYEVDRPINRLIRGALDVVGRLTEDPFNQQVCRELRFWFDRVPPTRSHVDDFKQVRRDRFVQHYDPAMPICQLILEGLNPLTQPGHRRAMSMLFPMESVFEEYVTAKMRGQFKGWRIAAQVGGQALVEDHIGRRMFNLRPDLELRRGRHRVIADTKWKLLDGAQRAHRYGISQADIYQLFAYSRKFLRDQELREVYLIYPKTDAFRSPLAPFWYREQREVLFVLPYDLETDELICHPSCIVASEFERGGSPREPAA
jgi:5-methylcytosine-specific restriction enzyme subunit McrC